MHQYPVFKCIKQNIIDAYLVMEESYMKGGKMLIADNGGSAADSERIVGELMKSFKLVRKLDEKILEVNQELGEKLQGALPTIALDGHIALSTAYMNDVETFIDLLCTASKWLWN